jgi:ABC-2 type transport system permease protein
VTGTAFRNVTRECPSTLRPQTGAHRLPPRSRIAVAGEIAWAFWRGLVLQTAESSRSPTLAMFGLIQPPILIGLALLGRPHPDPQFIGRTLAGVLMISLWSLVLGSGGTVLFRDRLWGVLGTLLSRPAPLAAVLLGRTCCVAVAGTATATATMTALVLSQPTRPALPSAGAVLFIGVLAATSAACLGVLLSATVLLVRGVAPVLGTLTFVVYGLGGLLIPAGLLPGPLRLGSALVSLHYLVEMVGARRVDPGGVVIVLVMSGAYLAGGLMLLRVALRRTRERGLYDFG